MRTLSAVLTFSSLFAASTAPAEELRSFCPDRPGLNTPTCVVDRGHWVIETSFVDWAHDEDAAQSTDTTALGASLIRYGLTDTLELRASWDGFGFSNTRDRLAHVSERTSGDGDLGLSLRQNFRNPDGSGFAFAAVPYLTLPTGSDGFTAGDWGAGLLVPVSFDLGGGVSFAMTPEIDAAVDADGNGRHVAFGSAIGLGISVTDSLSLAVETQIIRDDDPAGPTTTALAGLASSWMVRDDLQLDAGIVLGLNSESPDWELYSGVAKRF